MRRLIILSTSLLLLFTSCTKNLELRIDDLDKRITELETQVQELNSNIRSINAILNSVKLNDCITGVTVLENNVGYTVNFQKLGSFTIYHGKDVSVPKVGTKRDTDGQYYWTIQYGNNPVEFLLDENGYQVSAVGNVPLIKIQDGDFYVSYNGANGDWEYLGRAQGANGDEIFQNVEVAGDYVIFEMSNGQTFKIPTSKLVQSLNLTSLTISQSLESLSSLVEHLGQSSHYVISVEDLVINGEVSGSIVTMSDGTSFTVKDWIDQDGPCISAEKGPQDSVYYWAIVQTGQDLQWIFDEDGNRVAATSTHLEIPTVTAVRDTIDNVFYWGVVAQGDTTLMMDGLGNKLVAKYISDDFKLFRSINNTSPEYLVLILADGTTIMVPKQYAINFNTDSLFLDAAVDTSVNYIIYGIDNAAKYNLITQGDLTASLAPNYSIIGEGKINISTGEGFDGNGKVVLMVYAGHDSSKIMMKTINVAWKED